MHTQYPGIQATWKLPLDDKHHVLVFMWEDLDMMQATFEKLHPYNLHHDFGGFCMCGTQATHTATGEKFAPPRFAEIHLDINRIGAGYVAHELQHALDYYTVFADWTNEKNSEDRAGLAEKLTSSFWKQFYDHYQGKEKV